MLKNIFSFTLLALTAFYSVAATAQPGPPRSFEGSGPQQRGPQQRGPQGRPDHGAHQRGPQQRGPQGRPDHGAQQHGPQQRGPQGRPDHGAQQRGPQQRGPQGRPDHGPQQRGSQGGEPWQGKPQSAHGQSRERISTPPQDKRAEAARLMELTKKAVEAGDMTREQAMQRYNAWRQRNGLDREQADRPDTEGAPQRGPRPEQRPNAPPVELREEAGRISLKLRQAVEAGDITPEQARERFNQWRERQGTNAPQRRPQERPAPTRDDAAAAADVRAQGGRIWAELREAVEAGDMTREQAAERFNQWRSRMSNAAPSRPAIKIRP